MIFFVCNLLVTYMYNSLIRYKLKNFRGCRCGFLGEGVGVGEREAGWCWFELWLIEAPDIVAHTR